MTSTMAVAAFAQIEIAPAASAVKNDVTSAFAALLDEAVRLVQSGLTAPARTPSAQCATCESVDVDLLHFSPVSTDGTAAAVEAIAGNEDPSVEVPADGLASFLAAFIALVAHGFATLPGDAVGAVDDGSAASAFVVSVAGRGPIQGDVAGQLVEAVAAFTATSGQSGQSADASLHLAARVLSPDGKTSVNATQAGTVGQDLAVASTDPDALVALGSGDAVPARSASELSRDSENLSALAHDREGAQPGAAAPRSPAMASPDLADGLDLVHRAVQHLSAAFAALRPPVEPASGPSASPAADTVAVRDRASGALSSRLVDLALDAARLGLDGARGVSRVVVQLQPAELGRVAIEVQRTASGTVAVIAPATEAARQAILRDVQAIVRALQDAGAAVDRVVIADPGVDALEASLPSARVTGPEAPQTSREPGHQVATTPRVVSEASSSSATSRVSPPAAQTIDASSTRAGTVAASDAAPTPLAPIAEPSSRENGTAQVEPTVRPDGASEVPTSAAHGASIEAPRVAVESSAPSAPARGMALAREIAQQAELFRAEGRSEFTMQLHPQSLGRVAVRLAVESGQVTVRLVAESADTRAALDQSSGQLRQAFADRGIRVDRFEVIAAPQQFHDFDQNPRRSRGWFDERASVSRRRAEDSGFAAALDAARPLNAIA